MVILHLKLNNIYNFNDFEIDFSHPGKEADSLIEYEHIHNFPNFRYKKVNIIMTSPNNHCKGFPYFPTYVKT